MPMRLLVVSCLGLLVATSVSGQTFEVASVTPSPPGASRGGIAFGGQRIAVTAWTLSELMVLAYSQPAPLYRFQISGGPDWLDRERFDITATLDMSRVPTPPPA